MKVTNINGTSQNTCKCGSWLAHWKKFSGKTLSSYCYEKSCIDKPEVGAHVQKANSTDKNWYIIPFCKSHNSSSKDLELSSIAVLVSANKKQTCEK